MSGFGSMLKDYLDYYKITQTDFADRLGISSKHMNEILNGTTNLSETLMLAISLITDIDVNLIFYVENKKRVNDYLESNFKTQQEIKKFLNSFYINEMVKRNWLKLKDKESNVQNALDLLDYLSVRDFNVLDNYLNKRILYKKNDGANLKKIYLWIKHCDKIIENKKIANYNSKNIDKLLAELKILRNKSFNEKELVELFNKYGIYLVIEDALSGTKVRGCMKVMGCNPVIYLTKYLKDKASFYYTLYHEISHVKSDYNQAKNKLITDDDSNNDILDTKSDKFALSEMISDDIWQQILNNYENKDKICQENNIPLCFMYSRLAYLGYIKYSSSDCQKHKELIY